MRLFTRTGSRGATKAAREALRCSRAGRSASWQLDPRMRATESIFDPVDCRTVARKSCVRIRTSVPARLCPRFARSCRVDLDSSNKLSRAQSRTYTHTHGRLCKHGTLRDWKRGAEGGRYFIRIGKIPPPDGGQSSVCAYCIWNVNVLALVRIG